MSFKESTLAEFSPPGNLPELTKENRVLWSKNYISYWMNGEINADPEVVRPGRTPLQQFFNGTVTAYDQSQTGKTITWNAFPNNIKIQFGDNQKRWTVADSSRDVQDEYCEWSVIRDKDKNIIRAVYTCEGPEYFQFMAEKQQDTCLEFMYKNNAPLCDDVDPSAFFNVDPSNPKDRSKWVWNTTNPYNSTTRTGTIAHLIQTANTLGAEIDISSQATVLRENSDGPVTKAIPLCNCSRYGDPNRNSDPQIGYQINQLALAGNLVSVADPVALYMVQFDDSNFKLDPTGDQSDLKDVPAGTFTWQRGDISKAQGLRLKVEVPDGIKSPDGRQLTVGDIFDTKTQQYINFGAQITDYITMGVKGVVVPGGKPATAQPCFTPPAKTAPGTSNLMAQLKQKIALHTSPLNRVSN